MNGAKNTKDFKLKKIYKEHKESFFKTDSGGPEKSGFLYYFCICLRKQIINLKLLISNIKRTKARPF